MSRGLLFTIVLLIASMLLIGMALLCKKSVASSIRRSVLIAGLFAFASFAISFALKAHGFGFSFSDRHWLGIFRTFFGGITLGITIALALSGELKVFCQSFKKLGKKS
jgi:hypothetical protein